MDLKKVAIMIYDIGVVKFGDFTLRGNEETPLYFDFRILVSYPKLLHKISKELWSLSKGIDVSRICAVPYMAIPITTMMSLDNDVPMILKRKEMKTYGTKKIIEGEFNRGDNVLIIEDVTFSGSSVVETKRDLEKEGLKVTHALVILDRNQGAVENLREHGICIKSLFTLTSFLQYLYEAGRISKKNMDDAIKCARVCPTELLHEVLS